MGLEENKKANVQIDTKKKRNHLITIIQKYLETGKCLMEYLKAVAPTRKAKLVCNKSIKSAEQAIVHLRQIKHIEILEYLYSTLVGNNVLAYSVSGKMVLSEKIKDWDTDDGVKELIALMEENRKKAQEKFEEQEKTRKVIEEARKQGKKVDMIYDEKTKSLKPVVVEEKPNA